MVLSLLQRTGRFAHLFKPVQQEGILRRMQETIDWYWDGMQKRISCRSDQNKPKRHNLKLEIRDSTLSGFTTLTGLTFSSLIKRASAFSRREMSKLSVEDTKVFESEAVIFL